MARYIDYSYDQAKLKPISFSQQIIPGTFEFALNYIVDNELDLTLFEHRYRNDVTGAKAYDPAILLKVILYAYSRGIISSRNIARACEENVVFMALSADTHPHFTTIADFISTMQDQITPLFRDILLLCTTEGLIDKKMFAIDGCKISSNCSKAIRWKQCETLNTSRLRNVMTKEWSGTKADLHKKMEKIEKSVKFLVTKNKQTMQRRKNPNNINVKLKQSVISVQNQQKLSSGIQRTMIREVRVKSFSRVI
jgi:transposase